MALGNFLTSLSFHLLTKLWNGDILQILLNCEMITVVLYWLEMLYTCKVTFYWNLFYLFGAKFLQNFTLSLDSILELSEKEPWVLPIYLNFEVVGEHLLILNSNEIIRLSCFWFFKFLHNKSCLTLSNCIKLLPLTLVWGNDFWRIFDAVSELTKTSHRSTKTGDTDEFNLGRDWATIQSTLAC